MLGFAANSPTENQVEVRFRGSQAELMKLRRIARTLNLIDVSEWEFEENELCGMVEFPSQLSRKSGGYSIRDGRCKEGMTQKRLAELTGIAQQHISEMENGKRTIGKETAKKLATILNMDYRVFL
jgi:transcriptional regulator with XRE-family HTH domain